MTTPEQIIAKIEELETHANGLVTPTLRRIYLADLLELKQMLIEHFNLPTADPPEGSPGQEDMKQ